MMRRYIVPMMGMIFLDDTGKTEEAIAQELDDIHFKALENEKHLANAGLNLWTDEVLPKFTRVIDLDEATVSVANVFNDVAWYEFRRQGALHIASTIGRGYTAWEAQDDTTLFTVPGSECIYRWKEGVPGSLEVKVASELFSVEEIEQCPWLKVVSVPEQVQKLLKSTSYMFDGTEFQV